MRSSRYALLAAVAATFICSAALAQVKIGLMVSAIGPTTAIGIPQKNTGELLPRKIGDTTIEYFQLDDGGDTTRAVQNAKKLIAENNVDAIIGPSTTPNALAILDIIAEAKVPLLATVGTSSVVEPLDAKKRWVFKTTQNDDLIAAALVKHRVKTGVKTIGFIGFTDPYGENWQKVLTPMAEKAGVRLVAAEYYQLGKEKVEGTVLAAGPMLVIDEIAASNPIRKVALTYISAYEKQFGQKPATFGANTYDSGLILERAIPAALTNGKPGAEAFRVALRDAIEQEREIVGCQGVFNMSPTNHNGMDERARVLVTVRDGKFRLLPE